MDDFTNDVEIEGVSSLRPKNPVIEIRDDPYYLEVELPYMQELSTGSDE